MSEDGSAGHDRDGRSTQAPATSAVARQLHVGALAAYRRLPLLLKRFVTRRLTPSFHVAGGCVVQRQDDAILLVRHSYRKGWGLPGGLLKRNEHPLEAATREAFEELGVSIEPRGEPVVIIAPEDRRILVAFRAALVRGEQASQPFPKSPEIARAEWFRVDDLPELQIEVARAIEELGIASPPSRP